MKYNAPLDDNGKPYYIPVVTKNRDALVGYINGMETAKAMVSEIADQLSITMDVGLVEVILDSSRFNDVLDNGDRESEMTDLELKQYFIEMVDNILDKMGSHNQENDVYDENVLSIECECGLGFYSWQSTVRIPDESMRCDNCGRYLIHYTGMNDYQYEYDGGR